MHPFTRDRNRVPVTDHELSLLRGRLETTMAELGGRVDELEGDLLEGTAACLREEGFAQNDDTLRDTEDGTLEHEELVANDAIVREATHRVDGLLGWISLRCRVERRRRAVLLELGGLADAVDLLVHLRAVVVSVLTSASNRVRNTGRMPRANAGYLAESLVCLTW